MQDNFTTLVSSSRADLREKASRFFGFADPVPDELAAAEIRQRLKREYHDADHQPFAFRLASGLERFSDDGEPKGTAGPPILTAIKQANFHNVQIVVVRYFGGTKLGKGGLARAFGECARMTLQGAERKQEQLLIYLDVVAEPQQVGAVKAVASRHGASVAVLSFDLNARIRLAVPAGSFDDCREALLKRFGPQIFGDGL